MSAEKEEAAPRQGFIKRLRARLNRGDSWLTYDLANLAPGGKIDEDTLEELESLLVMADVGVDTTQRIVADLQKRLARKELKDVEALQRGEMTPQDLFLGGKLKMEGDYSLALQIAMQLLTNPL